MTISEILDFYDKQPIVYLSTIATDGIHPQIRAMVNIRNPESAPHLTEYFKSNDRILLITKTIYQKIAEIKNNNAASLYVHAKGDESMLLTGTIQEVTDTDTKTLLWADFLEMYYPGGAHGGRFSVLEFTPETYKTYHDTGMTIKTGNII